MKKILLVLLMCGSAHAMAKTEKVKVEKEPQAKEEKNQSMSAPNPITHYVNVCQQGADKDAQFIVCDKNNSSCVQEKRTPKNLAVAK